MRDGPSAQLDVQETEHDPLVAISGHGEHADGWVDIFGSTFDVCAGEGALASISPQSRISAPNAATHSSTSPVPAHEAAGQRSPTAGNRDCKAHGHCDPSQELGLSSCSPSPLRHAPPTALQESCMQDDENAHPQNGPIHIADVAGPSRSLGTPSSFMLLKQEQHPSRNLSTDLHRDQQGWHPVWLVPDTQDNSHSPDDGCAVGASQDPARPGLDQIHHRTGTACSDVLLAGGGSSHGQGGVGMPVEGARAQITIIK